MLYQHHALFKDLMFSKVNTKVFGNIFNTSFWMNEPHCVDAHIHG